MNASAGAGGHGAYGSWTLIESVPAFEYTADHEAHPGAEWDTLLDGVTRRHWVGVGNRRLQAFFDNLGTVALWDEHDGLRWLTAPDPHGTGVSWIETDGARRWGTRFDARPPGTTPTRTIGPTWLRVTVEHGGVAVERTVLCPEGEAPWVLVRVRLVADRPLRLRHVEEWALRPRWMNLLAGPAAAERAARAGVRYAPHAHGARLRAVEERRRVVPLTLPAAGDEANATVPLVFGPNRTFVLEALGETPGRASDDGADHPTLYVTSDVELHAGEPRDLWFRFGLQDSSDVVDPASTYASSLRSLAARLPRATAERAPMAALEVPWHVALLTGGACTDGVLGGHVLDQGSPYSYRGGINGAARDPLQHAIPLIYTEPDLAVSVLRNMASWARPDGFVPWCLDGAKQPRAGDELSVMRMFERASDVTLWALWLAAEYVIATGDVAAFERPVGFHPVWRAEPVTLYENLRGQFRYFVDHVGLGGNGHVRLLDCDWADTNVGEREVAGHDLATLSERGESVMNSALAAWVLPIWATLCDRAGDPSTAREARALAEQLRVAVSEQWNGRWFRRALCDEAAFGEHTLFLEVQPWAILCGAASPERTRQLLATIDERLRAGSPLGARQKWPLPTEPMRAGLPGESLEGGIWFALQAPLIWAAARHDPELAWDEWRRLTLANHASTYPEIWEGTLSGPESFNAPESPRPGRTRAEGGLGVQAFPVNNLHSHAQPLLAYLRLLGVEPRADGALAVGGGAEFSSRTFEVRADGTGRLQAMGEVELCTPSGLIRGGPGEVEW